MSRGMISFSLTLALAVVIAPAPLVAQERAAPAARARVSLVERIDSTISTALPAVSPNTSFISVRIAWVFSPAAAAVPIILFARSVARSTVGLQAPEPTLTSITSPSRPLAIFLDSIDAVINGTESTVAVTSRMA